MPVRSLLDILVKYGSVFYCKKTKHQPHTVYFKFFEFSRQFSLPMFDYKFILSYVRSCQSVDIIVADKFCKLLVVVAYHNCMVFFFSRFAFPSLKSPVYDSIVYDCVVKLGW